MSIPFLEVDMRGTFACGQAYVALSRAITFDGLVLSSYFPRLFKTDPTVVKFYMGIGDTMDSACAERTFLTTSIGELVLCMCATYEKIIEHFD